jgi:hypothetical protein
MSAHQQIAVAIIGDQSADQVSMVKYRKTAKALGLVVPHLPLAQADEGIE